jgi:hypothetical protein
LRTNDFEGALVNLFPALDQTAKRRWPKYGVTKRIKAFLVEEEKLISIVGTGNSLSNISVNGISITDALYKFGRTSIAHEGELDPKLEFNMSGSIQIGRDKWNLPSGYITGMCVAVIVAPENVREHIEQSFSFTIFEREFVINEIWGKPDEIKKHISEKFISPQLFSKSEA